MYLCDSGAQYLDGTTDVTRVFHYGKPTQHEKETFTRVLKGHIALDSVIFPSGTSGFQLDPIARLFLWQVGTCLIFSFGSKKNSNFKFVYRT